MELEYKYELSTYGYVYAAICIINVSDAYTHFYAAANKYRRRPKRLRTQPTKNRTFLFYSLDILFYFFVCYSPMFNIHTEPIILPHNIFFSFYCVPVGWLPQKLRLCVFYFQYIENTLLTESGVIVVDIADVLDIYVDQGACPKGIEATLLHSFVQICLLFIIWWPPSLHLHSPVLLLWHSLVLFCCLCLYYDAAITTFFVLLSVFRKSREIKNVRKKKIRNEARKRVTENIFIKVSVLHSLVLVWCLRQGAYYDCSFSLSVFGNAFMLREEFNSTSYAMHSTCLHCHANISLS